MRKQRKFLWLTDIHYEDPLNRRGGVAPPYDQDVFKSIESFLDALAAKGEKFDFIGVGGDLTTRGVPSGLVKFEKNILPRLKKLVNNLSSKPICIVPGNHDVVWGLDPNTSDYFRKKFAPFRKIVDKKSNGVSTCIFPKWSSKLPREIDFGESIHVPVFLNKKSKILVLNINSASRCGELRKELLDSLNDSWHLGITYPPKSIPSAKKALFDDLIQDVAHVTAQQKTALQKILNAKKKEIGSEWSEYLRVAVVHHHLGPYIDQHVDDRRYQHMVDSHSVLELLETFDFHIALSGHTHQAYQYKYLFPNGNEIFLVGGLTLGGYAVGPNGQGIRHITVESDRYQHKLMIRNVLAGDHTVGDVLIKLALTNTEELTIQKPIRRLVEQESTLAGHGCDELVSCTRVTRDGDALRSLDYRGYSVLSPKGKQYLRGRQIDLPSASGSVDGNIHARLINEKTGRLVKGLEIKSGQQKMRLEFEPALEPEKPVDYYVCWVALNAFALNQLQFDMKYPPLPDHQYEEFAYLTPDLPIRRLTLVVQFPHGFKFKHPPRMSVVRVDKTKDIRLWEEDDDATNALTAAGPLRSFRAFNAFSLVVKAPRTDRSYRIVWGLKDGSPQEPEANEKVLNYFNRNVDGSGKLNAGLQEVFDTALSTMVTYLRKTSLLGGSEEKPYLQRLDASLMIWNLQVCPRQLRLIAAIESPEVQHLEADGTLIDKWESLPYDLDLPYGVGIAGRTMKMNRVDAWDRKRQEASRDQEFSPDYYFSSNTCPKHMSLISFPLHVPARESESQFRRNLYRDSIPFAVLTVGSAAEHLAGVELEGVKLDSDDRLNSEVQDAQHILNTLFSTVLKDLMLKTEKPRRKG